MFYGDFRTMKRFLCHTSIYIKLNAKNDLSVVHLTFKSVLLA